MLEFRLNNRQFALDENVRVRLMWRNPACFIDEFPGDVCVNVSIPVNDTNRSLLHNPEKFEKYGSSADREYSGFEVRYNGYKLMSGTLILDSATKTSYSGWLRSQLGSLGEYNRERYINELPWKKNVVFENKNLYSFPEDEYCCPEIHNQAFWEGKGKMVMGTVTYQDENGQLQEKEEETEHLTVEFKKNQYTVNKRDGISGPVKTTEGSVVSPMLFIDYVIKEMFRMQKWYIGRNDWENNYYYMGQIFLYNNFNIMYPQIETETIESGYYDRDTDEYVVHYINNIKNTVWYVGNINYSDLVPHVKMKNFILGIQNFLNFIFHFRDDRRVHIIDRNALPDREPIDIEKWFVNEWEIGDKVSRRFKFTADFDKNDGYQGDSYQDLSDRIDDFDDPVETFADLESITNPQIGTLRLVRSENKVYEYKWGVHVTTDIYGRETQHNDVLQWEFVSSGPQPYLHGSGESLEEIKTCFSTPVMHSRGIFTARPGVLQQGNVGTMRSLWNDFSPRLLFNSQIFGSADISNGSIELNWDGEKGLIERRWKKWLRFWKDRLPVEAEFEFPLNVIDHVKNNIYEPFRTRHGKFIVEEMETEFGLREIGVTHIKGYKV